MCPDSLCLFVSSDSQWDTYLLMMDVNIHWISVVYTPNLTSKQPKHHLEQSNRSARKL